MEATTLFTPITQAALLRIIKEQGGSRCGDTFAPRFKPQTLRAIRRNLKKLRWPVSVEELSWGYDVLGAAIEQSRDRQRPDGEEI